MERVQNGHCSRCGKPITVLHTRSGTCRHCQVRAANTKMRLPPWDVIQKNIDEIVKRAHQDGSCFAVVDSIPAGPIMGHKL